MSSDMGDMWREVREEMREKRAANREASADILRERGVAFTELNIGAHLVVKHGGRTVDFWPGTGLWHARPQPGKKGRGVFRMLAWLGVTP